MKNRKKRYLWCFVKAILTLVLISCTLVFLVPENVSATDGDILSLETGSLSSLSIRPNVFGSADTSITVTTNNSTGYTLFMQTDGDSTNLAAMDGQNSFIPTITLPAGVNSVTADSIENGYGYSIDGVNFKPAPSVFGNGDVIAEINAIYDNEPDIYDITFGIKVGTDVLSGNYSRTFVFVAIANLPDTCTAESICYNGNFSDGGVDMAEQAAPSNSSVRLNAPTFSRAGYGFAGWNTKRNGTGTNYGPNEDITVGDLSGNGLILYAKWVESKGTLQNWNGCSSMSIGDVTALTDSRDGNTYAIAKLADGACWMTENLRLDFADPNVTITTENTNNPTAAFINAVNQHPLPTTNFCTSNNANCVNRIEFNDHNLDTNANDSWYSYGVYYNWHTATAGNGTYELSNPQVRVNGDICPAGWALPSGYGSTGDYALLDKAFGGSGNNATSVAMSNNWRKYPNNFLFSGQQNGGSITNRGETGNYQGATPSSQTNFYNFWLQSNKASTNSNGSLKTRGQNVRCMMQEYYTVHFDKNSSLTVDGTMYDQVIPRGYNVALYQNTFSISPQNNAIYQFAGWNTEADGSGASIANGANVRDLGENGETITLYAQWHIIPTVDITVTFPESLAQVRFRNTTYGDKTATPTSSTVTIVAQESYTVSASLDPDYDFTSWVAGSNITLGSAMDTPTTLIASANSTLSITATIRETTLYLQNLTASDCSATPRVAYDIRDGEAYHFQRLNDGNCWLLDNLRLGATTLEEELSSTNTNMEAGASLTLNSVNALNNYTVPEIDTIRNGTPVTNYGDGSGDAGVYYNYCAASAGTVCSPDTPQSASYDICPAGWRLPTGGRNGEYAQLLSAYNNSAASFNAALSISLAGWYNTNDGHVYKDFNKAIVLWTSTPSNNINKTYVAIVNATSVNVGTGYLENNGFSIRCLMKVNN